MRDSARGLQRCLFEQVCADSFVDGRIPSPVPYGSLIYNVSLYIDNRFDFGQVIAPCRLQTVHLVRARLSWQRKTASYPCVCRVGD